MEMAKTHPMMNSSVLLLKWMYLNVVRRSIILHLKKRSGKGWKQRYYLRQRARQERLSSSRKWKGEDHAELLTQKGAENIKPCKYAVLASESLADSSGIPGPDIGNKECNSREAECEISGVEDEDISSKKEYHLDNCSYVMHNSIEICRADENDCMKIDAPLTAILDTAHLQDEGSSSKVCNSNPKSKAS